MLVATAATFSARGRSARHLAEGMLEWRLDGLPVEAA